MKIRDEDDRSDLVLSICRHGLRITSRQYGWTVSEVVNPQNCLKRSARNSFDAFVRVLISGTWHTGFPKIGFGSLSDNRVECEPHTSDLFFGNEDPKPTIVLGGNMFNGH